MGDEGLTTVEKIGIGAGVLIFLVLSIIIVICFWKNIRKRCCRKASQKSSKKTKTGLVITLPLPKANPEDDIPMDETQREIQEITETTSQSATEVSEISHKAEIESFEDIARDAKRETFSNEKESNSKEIESEQSSKGKETESLSTAKSGSALMFFEAPPSYETAINQQKSTKEKTGSDTSKTSESTRMVQMEVPAASTADLSRTTTSTTRSKGTAPSGSRRPAPSVVTNSNPVATPNGALNSPSIQQNTPRTGTPQESPYASNATATRSRLNLEVNDEFAGRTPPASAQASSSQIVSFTPQSGTTGSSAP